MARGEGAWWWPILDLPLTAAAVGYGFSSIGPQNLVLDALAAMAYTILMACCCVIYGAEGVNGESDIEAGVLWFPSILSLTAFTGFHGLSIIVMWAVSVSFCLAFPAANSDMTFLSMFTTTSIAVGAVAMEFTIALLYHKWQRLLRCNEKLLERATDGFGAVDCSTGVVLSASLNLQETLGSTLVGTSLGSGIVHGTDSAALAKFFGDAEHSLLPEIVLVTWSAESFELDMRMVPYQLQDSQVGFCVQTMGERRYHTVSAPAEGALAPADEKDKEEEEQQQRQQQQQQ
eukprot:CAMPEP_0178429246 /NCGR_PEP_ID=MMETSP0689_2-20121128/30702_1 /TAXON_ID=160604 /ORGANISM="Amphidinium massartii, Strain CS-259" /LENGTH=287 /DNA_ID=CAMNT_0020051059 /DNA_START=133 /DNA_END=993 /DNA_ORIENTATION=+